MVIILWCERTIGGVDGLLLAGEFRLVGGQDGGDSDEETEL